MYIGQQRLPTTAIFSWNGSLSAPVEMAMMAFVCSGRRRIPLQARVEEVLVPFSKAVPSMLYVSIRQVQARQIRHGSPTM